MFGNRIAKVEKLTEKKKDAALISLTSDKSEGVRLAAIRGLGMCNTDDAYNALVPLVHASESSARRAAILALADMNRPGSRVHIEHQMRVEKDAQVLSAIQTALGRLREAY